MKTQIILYFLGFIAFARGHFFLLDGRAANYEAMRYSVGDSYYYSKLLCSPEFVNTSLSLRSS